VGEISAPWASLAWRLPTLPSLLARLVCLLLAQKRVRLLDRTFRSSLIKLLGVFEKFLSIEEYASDALKLFQFEDVDGNEASSQTLFFVISLTNFCVAVEKVRFSCHH
jgi:hypothetical protein